MYSYLTDDDAHPSNRYDSISAQQLFYDERGNTTFDGGPFIYVYDYLNRLSEVWTFQPVEPTGGQLAAGGGSSAQAGAPRPRYVVHNRRLLEECRLAALRDSGLTRVQIMRGGRSAAASRLSTSIPSGVVSLASGGSATQSLSAQMPTRLSPVAFYAYDAFERRTVRLLWGGPAYYYVYDGWEEVSELVPQGQSVSPVLQAVWGREMDELLSLRTVVNGVPTARFVAEGGAHCPQWLVDSQGTAVEQQSYDTFGRTWFTDLTIASPVAATSSGYKNPFTWKGHRVDAETGLVLMRYRYYSPGIGRFVSADPSGTWDDAMQRGNSYDYGVGSPLVNDDRMGLQVGHHIVPHELFSPRSGGSAPYKFSKAAIKVFEGATTGAPAKGLPRKVHAGDKRHREYTDRVRKVIDGLQESKVDLSRMSAEKAQELVDKLMSDPFNQKIERWLARAADMGHAIKGRGIGGVTGWFWRGVRKAGKNLAKPAKAFVIICGVAAFSNDAEAYGTAVAAAEMVNPIPFVHVADVLGIEDQRPLPPFEEPGEISEEARKRMEEWIPSHASGGPPPKR